MNSDDESRRDHEYPIKLSDAHRLREMNLEEFQEFCIGKPRTIFTENITKNYTMVHWLIDGNIEVLQYAINTLNANVNTCAGEYDESYPRYCQLHTSFHCLYGDDINLILTSDTLDISYIEYANMIFRLQSEQGALFWSANTHINKHIIDITIACIEKNPLYFIDCTRELMSRKCLSRSFINFILEKLPDNPDTKLIMLVISRNLKLAVKYAINAKYAYNEYLLYDRLFASSYNFNDDRCPDFAQFWTIIMMRLGDKMICSNGNDLLMLFYSRFMVGVKSFTVDDVLPVITVVLSEITIDWTSINSHIKTTIENKQWVEIPNNELVVFTMIRNGFVIPKNFAYGYIMAMLHGIHKSYYVTRKVVQSAFKKAVCLFKYLDEPIFTSETLKLFAKYVASGDAIINYYKERYWSCSILEIIPDSAITDYPDEIKLIAEKLQISEKNTPKTKDKYNKRIRRRFYARLKN